MRFFTLIDLHHLLLALFLGLAAAIIIYLSFRHVEDKGPDRVSSTDPAYLEGRGAGNNPVPPLLIVIYFGVALWIIFYVIFFALRGGPL
jgi:hypothetical protein